MEIDDETERLLLSTKPRKEGSKLDKSDMKKKSVIQDEPEPEIAYSIKSAPLEADENHPWTTVFVISLFGVTNALIFFYLLTPTFYEIVVSKIPFVRDDPFVHIVFDVFSKDNSYSYWQYLVTVGIMAPVSYCSACFFISVASGEWFIRRQAAISQMKEAASHLTMSAPFMSYMFKQFIEGKWGELYTESDKYSMFYSIVITPVCYWIITDASFYWQHRLFHSPWLYMQFHSFHHKCRPITTFCGNSAGLIELAVVEFCHALMPPCFLPIHAKTWIFLALGNQVWTIYLHTFDECGVSRLPGWIYDCRDHHVHHYYGIKNYNFGLFFQFWDRVMGTYLDKSKVDLVVRDRDRSGLKPVDEVEKEKTNSTKSGSHTPLKHLNTILPFIWTWRFGANVSRLILVALAIYCDLYCRVEKFPFHEWLVKNIHPLFGEKLPMFTIGGIGYIFLHLGTGTFYEILHRRRIQYPADVLIARNAQIREELMVWADGFATQLAVGSVWHSLVDPFSPWWGYWENHEYSFLWALAHIFVYFTYMDYVSFAVHYHILHGNTWVWENLHKQHHQIKSPTAFGGVAVHALEGVIQLALPSNLIFWFMPINFWLHSFLMLLILVGPALAGHDGSEGHGGAGPFDLSKHYYHHTTWHRGRWGYKNYALFWPFWDRVYGTFVNSEEEYLNELASLKAAKQLTKQDEEESLREFKHEEWLPSSTDAKKNT